MEHNAEAIVQLDKSIGALKDGYELANARRRTATLTEERRLLQRMGDLQAEILSQELLRLHLKRQSTIVSAPGNNAGKDLAEALKVLEQMRRSTDQFALFMNLAAALVASTVKHRQEIDERATD